MEVKPGYKRTEVGTIPRDWDVVLLDSVAKRGSGHTPDRKHSEYWNGSIRWISLADSESLDKLFISDTLSKITQLGIAKSSAVLHPAGTVVLSRDAGIGKSAIMRTAMAVSQHFMAWRCGPDLDNKFLYYWLQFQKPEFERIGIGSTIKTIGLPYFRQLKIPLPPLVEQKAITHALCDVDMLVVSLDRLIAKKHGLKRAAMQDLLTRRARIPGYDGDWSIKRLADVVEIKKGQLITGATIRPGSIPVIAGGKQPAYYHAEANRNGRTITISASGASAGFVALHEHPIFASDCSTISESMKYSLDFIYYQLQLRQQEIYRAQTGGAQPHIHAADLMPITFAIPEIPEQNAIVEVLRDMDAEIAALENQRKKIRELKQGMMQELLTGRTRLPLGEVSA